MIPIPESLEMRRARAIVALRLAELEMAKVELTKAVQADWISVGPSEVVRIALAMGGAEGVPLLTKAQWAAGDIDNARPAVTQKPDFKDFTIGGEPGLNLLYDEGIAYLPGHLVSLYQNSLNFGHPNDSLAGGSCS